MRAKDTEEEHGSGGYPAVSPMLGTRPALSATWMAGTPDWARVTAHLGPAGEWFVTRSPGGIEVEQRHGKGDVAARGPATSLMLMVLRRIPASDLRLRVLGDAGILAHWLDNSKF